MRLKVSLLVAVLCLAVASLAMAAPTASRQGSTETVTGTVKFHNTQHFQECDYSIGHQNGWVLNAITARGWWLEIWAVNNSAADPEADNANLASNNHFEVEFTDNVSKNWAAGRIVGQKSAVKRTGSGTLSVSRVPMTGLPAHAKYGLVGTIHATLHGLTTFYETGIPPQLRPNVTTGTLHVTASFACWLAPGFTMTGGK